MASEQTKAIISIIATVSKKIPDIAIQNGQLIFVQDSRMIAIDISDKRVFYNEIVQLDTDDDRRNLEDPVNGSFYFVITTALLWYFNNGWVQVTSNESGDSHPDIKFIGTVIPELGTSSTLYVNTVNQNITVWSDELQKYIEVADVTCSITQEEILNLF